MSLDIFTEHLTQGSDIDWSVYLHNDIVLFYGLGGIESISLEIITFSALTKMYAGLKEKIA